ncbi:cytosolic 5'-nucleotidase IIIB isoform X1 [Oratosquilla oratoria]|uniref:cytosolic 5'-nucleotidase IIIB isoform X1 n=1 Tax=Oratosquilla oratoria TaxID=337810 RepID=UPI003F772ADE
MLSGRQSIAGPTRRQVGRLLTAGRKLAEEAATSPKRRVPMRDKSSDCASSTTFLQPNSSVTRMPEYPLLEKVGLLGRPDVRMRDPAHVEDVLRQLIAGGTPKLQLVVDFDQTLTRVHVEGKRCHCSWGIMDNSDLMPAFYRDEANKLFRTFYPIEIDPTMSEEEKIPHMIKWYESIHALISKCRVSKDSIKHMVASSSTRLRDGTEGMMQVLNEKGVPVLVFSAGMGDILEHVLMRFGVYTPNVKVVSNYFKYNEEGYMVGFQGDLIHMFNKNENAIHSSDYFSQLTSRSNIILMGDSLGDINMAVGVPQPHNILRIGFLNDKVEERMESFMQGYDIILINDQTMDVASTIVNMLA